MVEPEMTRHVLRARSSRLMAALRSEVGEQHRHDLCHGVRVRCDLDRDGRAQLGGQDCGTSTTVHASPTRSDGVHARHLGVPTEPDAPIDLAPDHDPLAVQGHDLLAASVASQHDEGNLGPLGLQPALQFRDGRQGKDRRSHNRILVDAIPGDGCAEGRRPQREHVSGRVHQTDGFDWGDAAIGAVGALVIMLAVAGGARATGARRDRRFTSGASASA